ncbi:shieldin complex subunit 3 [Panthera pardus]|uniref:Shieldin complex subunit 3 n=1 Tax=Panthera pardus TaxID=9691 RepID=A0A9W2VXJ2_PANPR|nr:shieldin complex subunit 3 [Puma yagouaroundi]XP_042843575.1 shieldin complex subunit 3 [Panthera tigris]XP_042843576.1 shieldin complex subunit 3 [Panthera tigris]XP_047714352.1 shieldin complex subunit 3 [Prionailurus viverrinus]XP_049505510.1 shieldin complex subunit 3 [Panthera uncia]XP_053763301.1 shieldin complex subunit 3 [Panthera pardus]
MTTEVILHYRPYENDPTQLSKIAEKALQDFPTRPLSRFIPWFSHDGSKLPLKPKRSPPVISEEAAEDVKLYLTISEHDVKSQSYDCTIDLLEFQPNLKKEKHLIQSHTLNEQTNSGNLDKQSEKGRQHKKRFWSVSLPNSNCTENIFPLSKKLQDSLKALNLHSLYRARWTIEHTICNNQTLEDIWAKLNQIIRHNELPSCNATIQRHLDQIWVFCDIMYCEYVGNLLKGRLALTGKMNLCVRKYGVIFSM